MGRSPEYDIACAAVQGLAARVVRGNNTLEEQAVAYDTAEAILAMPGEFRA